MTTESPFTAYSQKILMHHRDDFSFPPVCRFLADIEAAIKHETFNTLNLASLQACTGILNNLCNVLAALGLSDLVVQLYQHYMNRCATHYLAEGSVLWLDGLLQPYINLARLARRNKDWLNWARLLDEFSPCEPHGTIRLGGLQVSRVSLKDHQKSLLNFCYMEELIKGMLANERYEDCLTQLSSIARFSVHPMLTEARILSLCKLCRWNEAGVILNSSIEKSSESSFQIKVLLFRYAALFASWNRRGLSQDLLKLCLEGFSSAFMASHDGLFFISAAIRTANQLDIPVDERLIDAINNRLSPNDELGFYALCSELGESNLSKKNLEHRNELRTNSKYPAISGKRMDKTLLSRCSNFKALLNPKFILRKNQSRNASEIPNFFSIKAERYG